MSLENKKYLDYEGLKTYNEKIKSWTIQQISEKSVQSDWNESDSNSPAYVKNRTHYTEIGINSIVESSVIFGYPSNDFMNGENESPFDPGETKNGSLSRNYYYNVTVDDQPTRKLRVIAGLDLPTVQYLGNSELAPRVVEAVNTDLNFCLFFRYDTVMNSSGSNNVTFFSTEVGQHTISVEKTDEPCVSYYYEGALYNDVPATYSSNSMTVYINGVERVLPGQEVKLNNGNTDIVMQVYGNASVLCDYLYDYFGWTAEYDPSLDTESTLCFVAPGLLVADGWYVASKTNDITRVRFPNMNIINLTESDWTSTITEPSNVINSWSHTYVCSDSYDIFKEIYLSREDEPFVEAGHTYTIIADDSEFEVTAETIDPYEKDYLFWYSHPGSMYNTMLLGDENLQDPPFYIVTYSTQKYDYYQSMTHNIYSAELRVNPELRGQKISYKIGERGTVIHKLDKIYLPDDTIYGTKASAINFIDTGFVTSTQVYNFVINMIQRLYEEVLIMGGNASSASSLSDDAKEGQVRFATSDFTYKGTFVEIGDMLIKTSSGWVVVQGNLTKSDYILEEEVDSISNEEINSLF